MAGQRFPGWIDAGLPGEGNILVFNNGRGRPEATLPSIDEITPPLDETGRYPFNPGEPYGPATIGWTYRSTPAAGFFASFLSGAQRLPNGNTLICHGPAGLFFEVDAAGEAV